MLPMLSHKLCCQQPRSCLPCFQPHPGLFFTLLFGRHWRYLAERVGCHWRLMALKRLMENKDGVIMHNSQTLNLETIAYICCRPVNGLDHLPQCHHVSDNLNPDSGQDEVSICWSMKALEKTGYICCRRVNGLDHLPQQDHVSGYLNSKS